MIRQFTRKNFLIQLLLAGLMTLSLAVALRAQETTYEASFESANKAATPINILVGQSRVINFDRAIGRFSISNPEIAEAVMVRPNQGLVNGKGFGQVNFIAWEKPGDKLIVCDVVVRVVLFLNEW